MPKIRFTRDELYESEGRNNGPAFSEGEVIAATQDFADRWTRRGSAEEAGKGEPAKGKLFERIAPPAEAMSAPKVDTGAEAAAQAAAAAQAQAEAEATQAAAAAAAKSEGKASKSADASKAE